MEIGLSLSVSCVVSGSISEGVSGTAMVWRWGQSNEGTLGNSPSQTAAQYRGAFPGIGQVDNLENLLSETATFDVVPYAVLADGDSSVDIDGTTISAPEGERTLIADNVPVGPTFGMANEYRDGNLFGSATDLLFWKASAAGVHLSYFIPQGEEAAYASGYSSKHWGWRYKCYANRYLRAYLANATERIFIQCSGDWQGEGDVVQAGTDVNSDYITQYMTEHAKIYQSDVDVLGVEPPYFKVALRRIYNGVDGADAVTDALNSEMAAGCRYSVDINGTITDTGTGHARMYFVDHGFEGVTSNSTDPHVTADEQRLIGLAISAALRSIHGGDGFTSAYELIEVKPQLANVQATESNGSLTVTGAYSDPGTVTVEVRNAQTNAVLATGTQVVTETSLQSSTTFSIVISGLESDLEIEWDCSLEIATGEVSVPKQGTLTVSSVTRELDTTFNAADFTYSNNNLTATRVGNTGLRVVKATPISGNGKIYFSATFGTGLGFFGIGLAANTSSLGGSNGSQRCGMLNGSFVDANGFTSFAGTLTSATSAEIAVDLDAGRFWVRSSVVAHWNEDENADPVAGTGGFDCSGMDLSDVVPMLGYNSNQEGQSLTLDLTGATAPAGFGPIG